jgi:hypothetical protein
MTQQDRWWLAISIVWLFLMLGGAALRRFRMKRPPKLAASFI